MSITFRAVATSATVNSTTQVFNKPTGVVSGDFMLLELVINGTTQPSAVPSGWALVHQFTSGGTSHNIYSLTAGGSEPSSYTFTWGANIIKGGGTIAYSSSTSATMAVDAVDHQANASSTNRTWPSVTTTLANTELCFFGFFDINTATTPAGTCTERWDADSPRYYLMTEAVAASGATGTRVATGASAVASNCISVAIAESVASGTLAVTEADDTLSAAGTVKVQGSAGITEANDTSSATGSSGVGGIVSITEANDTLSATGTVKIQAAAAITEANDTLSATGLRTPNAPQSVTATAITASIIDISWTDTSVAISGYKVERSANGTTGWSEIADVGPSTFTYANTGLASNTRFYYRVRSYRS